MLNLNYKEIFFIFDYAIYVFLEDYSLVAFHTQMRALSYWPL